MNVLLQENDIDTKAVVIMFGWFGAVSKHLKKYADLYVTHSQHKCAAVYGTASNAAIITRNDSKLTSIVIDAVRKAVEIIKAAESATNTKEEIPVILHYFSNGGAFVVEKFWLMMKKATISPRNTEEDEYLQFINTRLKTRGFEVLDSAPAYVYDDTARRVIDSSVRSLFLRNSLKILISITIVLMKTSAFILKKENAAQVFWRNMLESNLCRRQAFVYSSIDKLTDAKKLSDFVEARRKHGIEIIVVKFDDSDHVLHMKKHPKEYKEQIVDRVLNEVVNSDVSD